MKLLFPFTVSVNKCGGSCHTIKDLYPWVCYKYSKNMNVKIFYLKSVVNETRFTVQYNFRECKCGLNKSVYNSKKKLNSDECQCEPFKN